MLKEEKELREWKDAAGVDSVHFLRDVRALIRAVREDCAKVAEFGRCGIEPMDNPRDRVVRDGIAAAIRGEEMTDLERKAREGVVNSARYVKGNPDCDEQEVPAGVHAILAANAELKRLREEVARLMEVGSFGPYIFGMYIADGEKTTVVSRLNEDGTITVLDHTRRRTIGA